MGTRAGCTALAALLVAGVALAQEPRWSLDVFGRLDGDDEPAGWGLLLGRGPDTGNRFELLLESRREDVFVWEHVEGPGLGSYRWGGADLYGLHLGLGRYWVGPRFFPFVAASIGVTVARPDFGPVDSESFLTASVGGGFEVRLGGSWLLRLDGRAELVGWEDDPHGWRNCSWFSGTCVRVGGENGFGGATVDTLVPILRIGLGARW